MEAGDRLLVRLIQVSAVLVLVMRGPKVDTPHKGAVEALRHRFP
jgi:hypothetical protein